MSHKSEISISLFVTAVFVSSLLFALFYGPAQRVYLDIADVRVVSDLRESLEIWRVEGLKGRVLYFFDRDIGAGVQQA